MRAIWVICVLVVVATLERTVWCKRRYNSTSIRKSILKKGIVLTEKQALRFLKSPKKVNSLDKEDVREECCEKTWCEAEEIEEFSEDHSWLWVQNTLCELSRREGKTCGCTEKSDQKHYYECGTHRAGTKYCPNPCPYGKFYCGSYLDCVPTAYTCDSDRDCTRWEDEKGCRITTRHSRSEIISKTKLVGGSRYWGNVYVIGRPVCDDFWDNNDAKVLCKTLGFNSNTKGIAWTNSKFGTVGSNFRMDDVRCGGYESYIGECPHVTSNNCGSSEGAGVTCVDPTTVKLRSGEIPVEGNVYIMDQPVCDDNWDMNDAKVVCNQLFKSKFSKRPSKGVPVFSVTRSSRFGGLSHRSTSINNVNCGGTETDLAQCAFSANIQCEGSKIAGVQCAKCTPDDLLSILGSIKAGANREESYKSVYAASQRLKSQCWNWDCSNSREYARYPEFCKVSSFFKSSMLYLKPVKEGAIKLQTKFDYGDLLNHLFMKVSFSSLQERIFKLGDKISDEQKKLGSYFSTLANFDRVKAEEDLEKARELWSSTKSDMDRRQHTLRYQITAIFVYAFGVVAGDLMEEAAELSMRITDTVNPFNWGSSDAVINIKNVIKRMLKAGAKIARLAYALDKGVDKINAIASRLREKRRQNARKFGKVRKLLEAPSGTPFTLALAKEFLEIYKDFEPSVKGPDITEYHTTLSMIVGTACEVIKGSDSIPGALIETAAAALGACPKVQTNLEVVTSLYDVILEKEEEMIKSTAQVARARVAQEGANALSEVLGDNLSEEVTRQVAKWDSLFLLQTYKETLIKRACDYITYRNHGEEEKTCTNLIKNPSLDAAELISFNYKADMCACSTCSVADVVVPIPAMIQTGNNTLPKGTVDLSFLYNTKENKTHGWINFEIPNTKWLLDYGWITSDMYNDGRPFFLQSLQLFLPPGLDTTYQYAVNTKMVLTGNYMNGKAFMLSEGMVMKSRYLENYDTDDCPHKHNSLYNIVHCPKHFGGVCVTVTPNDKGPIYPLLVGSTWKISLQSLNLLNEPVPEGPLYIQAKAKFCFRSSAKPVKPVQTHASGNKSCCYDRNMYFDQIAAMKTDGKDPCRPCPEGSATRMYGFYCESCSAGYETKHSSFGCSPCEKGKYKPNRGPGLCQPCPAGTTTITTGQGICKNK